MTDFTFLQDLLILLGLALGIAFLCSRIRLSPIIGYLLTGLLAGPYGLNLVAGVGQVELLAEIGVILLLFTIGLEFSVSRILRLKGLLLKCGTTQVLITGLLVFLLSVWLGLSLRTATVLAMALALSSTAIVLKLLLEKGELDSAQGRISLAILLFQDLTVVLFLVGLPLLSGKGDGLSLYAVGKGVLLLAGLLGFSRYLLHPLLISILRTRAPELFRLTILALVLGTAWVTHLAGLSLALGAFLAGLALAESDYAHQVFADILPFRDTFLAIFFISMGMLVNLQGLSGSWLMIGGLFVLLCLIKALAAGLAALWARYPLRIAVLSGLILFQVGEFSFILLRQALELSLIPEPIYQTTLFLITLSMMATPLVFTRAGNMATWAASFLGQRQEKWDEPDPVLATPCSGHVVIAGFGLAGRNVAKVLREEQLPYTHIEMNGEIVRQARQRGEAIVYGDATSATVLEAVGIDKAKALVVAINDPGALTRIVQAARALNPGLYILVRTRFVLELEHLAEIGANEVIADEFEASLELAASLLRRFGLPEGRTLKRIASLRKEHYEGLREPMVPPTDLAGYLSVLQGGRIEFLPLPEGSPAAGQTLAGLQFRSRTETTVVGVARHEQVHYHPNAQYRLEPEDTLLLLGGPEDLERARKLLQDGPDSDLPAEPPPKSDGNKVSK